MKHQEAVATLASERYLLGEMTEAERDSFEEHFFDCVECADDVRAGERMKAGVRQGLASAQVVLIRRAWRASTMLPWAAAATLAVVAGYQSMQLRNSAAGLGAEPLALAPMTLRAASRGQEPVVTPGPSGVVTLAVDVSGGTDSRIRYTLKTEDGKTVASGEAPAPVGGAPLLLMLPAGVVKAQTRYVLATANPGNPGLTGEEYRFRVEAR